MKHKQLLGILMLIIVPVIINLYCLPWDIDESDAARTGLIDNLYIIKTFLNPKAIIRGNDDQDKLVALTIDDGPDPRYTPQILNILQQYHIKATFFVVGENIKKHPNLLIRAIWEGNEIENHTFSHPNLRMKSVSQTEEEIIRNQELILSYTHRRPQYFRPPKGLLKKETIGLCESYGYRVVLWTICVEHTASKTPQVMAARVVKAASPDIIILAHDGRLDRSKTVKALPLVIEGYKKKGYRFVTLDEMFKQKKYQGELALQKP
ncbi:MAG TPA: polysaccharide deacetylase family protein [Syntrophomonadaceae bacterium]|nr:polysaccharide deacetylase family protein [Syntrophomonadaceae bacterium]